MKAKEFSKFLDGYVSFLQQLHATSCGDILTKVSAFFQARADTVTVDAALKLFAKIDNETLVSGNSVHEFLAAIKTANSLLQEFGKPAVTKDIAAIIAAFGKYERFDIASVLNAAEIAAVPKTKPAKKAKEKVIRHDLIRSYCERLEAAKGDDNRFPAIYAELSEQKILSADELKELSKLFRAQSASTRPAALKNIWARHLNLVDGRARDRATGGRTAA